MLTTEDIIYGLEEMIRAAKRPPRPFPTQIMATRQSLADLCRLSGEPVPRELSDPQCTEWGQWLLVGDLPQ